MKLTIGFLVKANLERLIIHINILLRPWLEKFIGNHEEMDAEWELALNNFRKNGFVKLPLKFDYDFKEFIASNQVNDIYTKTLQQNSSFLKPSENLADKDSKLNCNEYGQKQFPLSLKSPVIEKILNSEVKILIKRYLGNRRYWLRNSPVLCFDDHNREKEHGENFFHLDHANHQLSILMYLSDVTETSTKTIVIPRTSKKFRMLYEFFDRRNPKAIEKANREKTKHGEFNLCGPKLTAFLIDAGNMMHKAEYLGERLMLHFNFSTSTFYCQYEDPDSQKNLDKYFTFDIEKVLYMN